MPILNDAILEPNKTFQANLRFEGSEALPRVTLEPDGADIDIMDNDGGKGYNVQSTLPS